MGRSWGLPIGHTYTCLVNHIVFSTKERRPLLNRGIFPSLVKFTGGIIRKRKGKLLAMNGTENHVHILGIFSPTIATSDLVRDLKALSSGWIHDNFPHQEIFAWQEGYSAFSVGKAGRENVIRYIKHQEKHHRKKTFEEELVEMLDRADIEYELKYLFD